MKTNSFLLIFIFSTTLNQSLAQPSLIFNKKLFGYEQNGPSGLPGCIPLYGMPDVFTKITGQNPSDPDSIIYGNCSSNTSQTFAGAPAVDFRMTFTESMMTLYDVIENNRSESVFTGGKSYIEKYNSSSGLYDTILIVENFTIFVNLKCSGMLGIPAFNGHVIGDIAGGNQAFINEFTNNGATNQIKANFLNFTPPSTPDSIKLPVMTFRTVVELVPMPAKAKKAFISGQQVPGADSTMTFPANTGTNLKLSNFSPFSTDPSVIPSVTVCHYPWKDTISSLGVDKSYASVFTNVWWLMGSNLNNINGEMCFNYEKLSNKLKRKFKPSQLAKLSGSWHDSSGGRWNKIDSITRIDTVTKEICFKISHFSNWTIALEKPAADRIVPLMDGTPGTFVSQIDTLDGFELKFPGTGSNDTISFERYGIDPGGEYDTLLVEAMSDRFWELNSEINSEGSVGLALSDTINSYTMLYRPNPSMTWSNLPVTRVRRGMKEHLLIKPSSMNGQYIIAKSRTVKPVLFSSFAFVDTACVGNETTFTPTIVGGVSPFTYIYDFGDGTTIVTDYTGAPQKHLYNLSGSYSSTITIIDENLVEFVLENLVVINSCSVSVEKPIQSNDNLEIFPNPSSESIFRVRFNSTRKNEVNLTVMDAKGKQILNKFIQNPTGSFESKIDLSGYPKGIYLLKCCDGTHTTTLRLFYP
ncbi:MAG: hypothetical protein A3G23_02445 [Bacteroidetes bacterium RIFCSPLOWO2_12_FULL_37_12]|nr:MAG: hypothetical protein A3G23_02445 [Bacteroidetes bacterium RIFCSPLOWO2_12_FULL_37_12]